jgi:predicted PurR-regulated permease PerM
MSIHWRRPRYRIFFLVAFTLGILLLGFFLQDIVNPLLLAVLVSYILNPLVKFLESRGLSRQLSVVSLFVTAFLLLALALGLFGVKIYHNFTEIRVVLLGEPLIAFEDLGKDPDHVGPRVREVKENKMPVKQLERDRKKEPNKSEPESKPAIIKKAKPLHYRDLNGDGRWQIGLIQRLSAKLRPHLSELSQEDMSRLTDFLKESGGKLADIILGAMDSAKGYASSLWNVFNYLVLVPIYSFFILLNFSSIKDNLARHLPTVYRAKIIEVWGEIDRSVAAFFRGRLFIAVMKGLLTGLGFWIVGIPFGFAIGLTAGLLSFVPALGPLFALVLSFVLGVAEASSVTALLFGILLVLAIAEAVEAVAYPVVLGKEVGLHPVALIFGFLVFGKLFGLFGILLAVPIASIVKILLGRFVLPEIQALAGLDLEADDGVGQGQVDDQRQNVIKGGDEGTGGQRGVDLQLVAGQGNDGAEQGGVDDAGDHGDADDEAKLNVLEKARGDKGEAPTDSADE